MTTFRTTLNVPSSAHPIGLKSPVFTIGSCFADAIGERLRRHKFSTLVNPFGVVYNPLSIHKSLEYALDNTRPPAQSYVCNEDRWLNFDFHSSLSGATEKDLEGELAKRIAVASRFLADTSHLLITYGTAWVYRRTDNHELVANCHKLPAAAFTKSLLSEQDILVSFGALHTALKKKIPGLKLILTVSPVRHTRDTLPLNSVSKSLLRVACHRIVESFEDVDYFPAYEMMMDDLRDYRFYRRDMIHPTEEAEDYIWEKFSDAYFGPDEKKFIAGWQKILAALNHRPFHPASKSHEAFLQKTLRQLEQFATKVNVEEEMAQLKSLQEKWQL